MKALFDSQLTAIEKLSKFKVGALFMEAGTGKTRPAVELINSVDDIDAVVWVGPIRSIKPDGNLPSVLDEIDKWGGFTVPASFFGVESIQSSDRIYFELTDKLRAYRNPFLVVDESLKIKNFEAKRTKRMLNLGEFAEYKLILNGTPVTKNLMDMWSQMEFLSPKILNMGYSEFKNTFCKYTKVTKYFGGKQSFTREFITGYENIEYLYSLIGHYIFECDLKMQVNQLWNDYRYQIDDESLDSYYYLKSHFLDDETLKWKNNNIFMEMTQKMQHTYCCSEGKFQVLDEHFREYPQEKHIIFCKYVDSRMACEKRYPKATVLSYQKESLSLNLQHLPYTIFFDKNWDYALRHQSSRRNFRAGQEYDCRYWDMTGNVGLEKMIDLNINKKTSMAEYFKTVSHQELKEAL